MNGLAEWVVDEQLVSPEQLEGARRHQQDTGVPLATALIELHLLDEGVLVDLLSRRHELPKAPRRLHRMTVASKALSAIPQDYCWQHGMFPFGFEPGSRKLQVAIGDPADAEAIALLRKIARDALLYVAGPRQLEKAIRKHYLDSWIDDSQANAKPLRFFGYENITSPGTTAPTRPGAPEAAQTPRSTSPLAELAMAVPPEVQVVRPAAAPASDPSAAAPINPPTAVELLPRTPTPPLMSATVPPTASVLRRVATPAPPASTDGLLRSPTPPPVPTEARATDGSRFAEAMDALRRSPTVADPLLRSPTPPAEVGDTEAAIGQVQLAKLQPADRVAELQLRVEALERAMAELLSVIGVGAQESATRLTKISVGLRRAAERKAPPK
jgi:hypothetical protein